MNELLARLVDVLKRYDRLAVAVSGGVDSMTLAYVAHRFGNGQVSIVHATSPAVPALATVRVRAYAEREGWNLQVLEAGEFDDPAYRSNPNDRCYFCKSNLYDSIAANWSGPIASGANVDDLDDYRPGLKAAAERNIVHPFVEAGIDKAGIRELARLHGLDDISDLPAQPCLASRIETGIRIEADDLDFVDLVERDLRSHLEDAIKEEPSSSPEAPTVRCRITHKGVAVEVSGLSPELFDKVAAQAAAFCANSGRSFAGVRPYRRGSAFLGVKKSA